MIAKVAPEWFHVIHVCFLVTPLYQLLAISFNHLLPRLFDGSCDGDNVGCSDDAGFAGAGGGRDVSDGGDSGGGDSGGVDSVGDGGGDSVSFLLPTLPGLACLVLPPPPSSTGDPSPVLSGNLAMAALRAAEIF